MTGSTLPTQLMGTRTVFDDTVEALGGFRAGYPKFYSIADLGTQSRRRWVPLEQAVDSGRVELMFRNHFAESGDIRFSTYLVAEAFTHGVLGRAVASFVTIGRVWDTGAENMAVRTDIEGGLDWAGVRDTTLRVLPDDPVAGSPGTVILPCEQALAQWLASTRHKATAHIARDTDDGVRGAVGGEQLQCGDAVVDGGRVRPRRRDDRPHVRGDQSGDRLPSRADGPAGSPRLGPGGPATEPAPTHPRCRADPRAGPRLAIGPLSVVGALRVEGVATGARPRG